MMKDLSQLFLFCVLIALWATTNGVATLKWRSCHKDVVNCVYEESSTADSLSSFEIRSTYRTTGGKATPKYQWHGFVSASQNRVCKAKFL
jgi:hypothetical protein